MLPAFDTGLREARNGRCAEARAALEKAGREGDPRGWLTLGQLASQGDGEPENPAKAAVLYRRAADEGCAGGAHGLGALYALGRGVPRDLKAALEWYRRAADLGDQDGSFKVGLMLARGEVEPPTTEAFAETECRWRALAANGHLASLLWLGHLYSYLRPESAPVKAASWYLDVLGRAGAHQAARDEAQRFLEPLTSLLVVAAYSGDIDAAFALGRWYLLTKNRESAVRAFEQAAAANHHGAQRALADVYDDDRAISLYESAASGGDALAAIRLGVRLAIGNGVPKDPERAVAMLERAAQQGNVDGMVLLGEQLDRVGRHEDARPWHVRGAERGQAGAMLAAAQSYRRGSSRDLVQAVRWYWALLNTGNGDGIHEVHQLAGEMTNAELREAARLAGDPVHAEATIVSMGRAENT